MQPHLLPVEYEYIKENDFQMFVVTAVQNWYKLRPGWYVDGTTWYPQREKWELQQFELSKGQNGRQQNRYNEEDYQYVCAYKLS